MLKNESNSFVFNLKQEPRLEAQFEHEAIPSFLSVIIPVYQDVQGLTDTLFSLEKQTLSRSKFEIIVVNDGGDPAISAACAKFPVTEVVQVPNQGSYAARNAGLNKSRGACIGLLDADEIVDPEWCANGFEALSRAHVVVGQTRFILSSPPSLVEIWQEAHYFPVEQMVRQRVAATANLFLRREVFEKVGWFDARLRSGGDLEFTYRAGQDATLEFIHDPTVMCHHPARNYDQVIQSISRIAYGQLAAHQFDKQSRVPIPSFYRLFFPPARLSTNDISHLHLGPIDYVRLYFFTWLLKWKTAMIRLSVGP